MKNVLVLNTTGMGYEGISSVIMNYIENMDLSGISLNVAVVPTTKPELIERIEKIAAVHLLPQKKQDTKGYMKELSKLLKSGIDVFHIHGNSGMMFMEVMAAKRCHVKKIIVHCHNTTCDHLFVSNVLKHPMKWFSDELVSCSEASGKWLYGKSRHTVLNNAINIERFAFNEAVRNECRNEFGVDGEVLFGHIGHFTEQKNHGFLIDIFAEIHKKNANTKLLLVSIGPKMDEIRKKVSELGLDDSVIFAGQRSDVDRIYQALDLFIMPSKWEGLPVVMLEAQAAALPLVVSDVITRDAECTDRVTYLSLEDSSENWAKTALEKAEKYSDRGVDVKTPISSAGFDIKQQAEELKEIYLKGV